jgi:hypothetical protein
MDGTRGDSVPKIHLGFGRLELWSGAVGDYVVWRTTILELVEPGRHQEYRKGLQAASADGLSGGVVPTDVGLLAKTTESSSKVR